MKTHWLFVILAMSVSACVTRTAPQPPEAPGLASGAQTRQLRVVARGPDFEVTDASSVEQRLALALLLFDRGRFKDAARTFKVLAEGQHNPFGYACLRSAAVSSLLAADRVNFMIIMQQLRARLGAERLASAPLAVEVLLALEAFFNNTLRDSPLPRVLDPILPSTTKD